MIGIGLFEFGIALAKAPLGINALVFGIAERSLVPFGLHHAFYAPLWFTSAGGSFNIDLPMFFGGHTTGQT
jgi:PTS system glucose-specific IIC component